MGIVGAVHTAAVAVKNHIAEKVSDKSESIKSSCTENTQPATASDDSVELSDSGFKAVANGTGSVVSASDSEEAEEEKTTVTVSGTDGNDTIDVTINKDGSYSLVVNGEETTYTADEAERLVIDGGDGDDTVNIHQEGSPNSHEIAINGGDGNDVITADEEVKNRLTIDGGQGNDKIAGGSGSDTITDNYGNNYIDGGQGNDEITAQSSDSNNSVFAKIGRFFGIGEESPENTIFGGEGDDTITTGAGEDRVFGGAGDDEIDTGKGDDAIYGGEGDDIIYAGAGNDTVRGAAGHDYIEGNHGNDDISGGEGNDVVYGGKGDDKVSGGTGDDFVNAGKGNDTVHGNAGNDTIFGLNGNDTLYGDVGDDTVVAGDGKDQVSSGAGNDTIRVTSSVFEGTDEVIDGIEEGDDYKVLNTIDVPSNFKVESGQSERFTERINDDLEAFAAIEPGQEMLTQYAETGHKMSFVEIEDQNCYASTANNSEAVADVTYSDDGTRSVSYGDGTDSTIKINPSFTVMSGDEAWSEANSMVLLAHEMSHAYNNAMGNKDYSFYDNETGERVDLPEGTTSKEGFSQRAVRGAEQQAVGMFDDSNVAPNPYGISENDYRAYFHMPLRDSYMSQTETQHDESLAAGNALSDEYSGYAY